MFSTHSCEFNPFRLNNGIDKKRARRANHSTLRMNVCVWNGFWQHLISYNIRTLRIYEKISISNSTGYWHVSKRIDLLPAKNRLPIIDGQYGGLMWLQSSCISCSIIQITLQTLHTFLSTTLSMHKVFERRKEQKTIRIFITFQLFLSRDWREKKYL